MKNYKIAEELNPEQPEAFKAGQNAGYQQAVESMICWLYRQHWNSRNILRARAGVERMTQEYAAAFHAGPDQARMQERLDRAIDYAIGNRDYVHPFAKRYPEIMTAGNDALPRKMGGIENAAADGTCTAGS